jgi:hypothetical protein
VHPKLHKREGLRKSYLGSSLPSDTVIETPIVSLTIPSITPLAEKANRSPLGILSERGQRATTFGKGFEIITFKSRGLCIGFFCGLAPLRSAKKILTRRNV